MSTRLENRASILATFGASTAVTEELLAYDPESLGDAPIPPDIRMPLDDEPFVYAWREYCAEASASGLAALADRLVQLHFPIHEGISQSEEYRAATRRGEPPATMSSATGLVLLRPEACTVTIHSTWAGSIPVIETGCREDFVSLLRAFTARNEPIPVPASQGASIVAGYNNWDRVRRFRERWMLENPDDDFSLGVLADLHDEYQDRFILLSSGWYSGVRPEALGFTPSEWQRLSMTIRREHECAHYWTRRVLSSMRNRVLDEIIADYCGIYAACGRFRADWLLAFFGIDDSRECRDGGRLHNYRGTPPLSDDAFGLLVRVVHAAIDNLARFDRRHADELTGRRGLLLILLTLSRMSLEDLACRDSQMLLANQLQCSRALAAHGARG